MSIEVIDEALELLRIAQSGMGPDRSGLDEYDRAHWDRISKCRQELEKLKQQEPAKYEFQNRDGTWHGFLNESHYQNTVEDGSWPIRALYAAPVPAAVPEGWKLVPVDPTIRMLINAYDSQGEATITACETIYRAMLSAAPAAPAVTDDVVKDAGIAGFKPWPVTHLKTGNEYRVIGEAIDATNATEGRTMVIYRGNGQTFVREASEFMVKFSAVQKGGA